METQDNINQAANDDVEIENSFPNVEYAGFWVRFLASVLDSVLLVLILIPLLMIFYGPGVLFVTESPGLAYNLINYGLPIIAVIIFWQYRSATPGKIMMGIYIVDEKTLGQPSFGRLVLRYFGYYVSILPLLLGFIWVAFDKRKQGFHDKIARTLVIKQPPLTTEQLDKIAVNKAVIEKVDIEAGQEVVQEVEQEGQDPWKE
mgnify:CR=1 FL=1|jgi:uncharacterized RDD family membrane protein YckC